MLQCHQIFARLEGVEYGFLLFDLFGRVSGRLDGEANAAIRPVNLDHSGRHFFTHTEDVLDFLDPLLADLADMHQAVDVVIEPDERSKAGELGNLALDEVADLVQFGDLVPRVIVKLLDADGDALVFAVDFEHLCLNVHSFFQNLGRVVDPAGP